MAIFHSNPKIRVVQVISIITACSLLPNKYFPNSNYAKAIKPFNLYIVILFFVAQAFMIYFIIQENKIKKMNSNA